MLEEETAFHLKSFFLLPDSLPPQLSQKKKVKVHESFHEVLVLYNFKKRFFFCFLNFKLTSQLFKHTEKVTFGKIIKNFKFEDNKQLASYSPGIIMKRQVMFIQIQNHGSTAIWLLIQPWLAPARSQQEPDLQQELERHIHLSQLPGEESVVLQVPFHSSGW